MSYGNQFAMVEAGTGAGPEFEHQVSPSDGRLMYAYGVPMYQPYEYAGAYSYAGVLHSYGHGVGVGRRGSGQGGQQHRQHARFRSARWRDAKEGHLDAYAETRPYGEARPYAEARPYGESVGPAYGAGQRVPFLHGKPAPPPLSLYPGGAHQTEVGGSGPHTQHVHRAVPELSDEARSRMDDDTSSLEEKKDSRMDEVSDVNGEEKIDGETVRRTDRHAAVVTRQQDADAARKGDVYSEIEVGQDISTPNQRNDALAENTEQGQVKNVYRNGGMYVPTYHGAHDMDELKRYVWEAEHGRIGDILAHTAFKPRHNAYTSLLQMVGKAKQADKAIEIFEAMKNIGHVQPNTFSYSALISALARVGRWKEAELYFEEMKMVGENDDLVKPNMVTYAAMISAYEKAGMLEKALDTYREQIDSGIEADVITYASLLSACEKAKDVKTALELLDVMHSQGIVGPTQMYHGLIASCGASWACALEIFLGMQCVGVEVNTQSLNLLMNCFCLGGQKHHAMWLMHQACKAHMTLHPGAYVKLLQLLADDGDAKAADQVYKCMISNNNVIIDGTVAGLILSAHIKGGADNALIERLNAMFEKSGASPILPVKQELVEHDMSQESPCYMAVEKSHKNGSLEDSMGACSIDSIHSEVTDVELYH